MSPKLLKATLTRLAKTAGKGKNAHDTVAPQENTAPINVQFNPTSLKITRQNNVDRGGSTTRTQARQNPSTQSAVLSFDLEFDTAEGDGNGGPKDVRDLTASIRQFVEPDPTDPTKPPPPVRFIWGTFHFSGIVTSLVEDLDYFSPEGRPLRAKVSVSITEQDARWEANFIGPGAATATAASLPGESGAKTGLGAAPTSKADHTAVAQAGESVQQLLTRVGADPASWRTAMAGLSSPLSLSGGAQVQFSAGLSAGAGIGASAGFAAGAQLGGSASLGAALGLGAELRAGASLRAGGGLDASGGGGFFATSQATAGFALAEGGGLSKSMNIVLSARASAQLDAAKAAFTVPGGSGQLSLGIGADVAGSGSGSASTSAQSPPRPVDPRQQGYGMAIPLRARPVAGTAPWA